LQDSNIPQIIKRKERMKKIIILLLGVTFSIFAADKRILPANGEFQCGVNFGFYAREGWYESPAAREEVDEMARTGVDWVTVIVTVFQETWCSTLQYRDFAESPNDIELKEIIDYIHSKGMKVCLRPMEEAQDGTDRYYIRFPADMERIPGKRVSHASRWFDSMKKRTRFYAKVAERTKCEAFCIDSELNNIVQFNKEWREVVAAVREVYHGPVTSCFLFTDSFAAFIKSPDCWLRELDFLSVSDYDSPGTKPGAGVEAMKKGLERRCNFLRNIAKVSGMKILFGEVGCTSTERTAECLWRWSGNGGYNGKEQADLLEAKFTLFEKEPWCLGFMWWKWDEQNNRAEFHDDPAGDKGFTIRGKPAQEVMRRLYTRKRIQK
jgi:hypothetical protein